MTNLANLYTEYRDEADFRSRFVIPLLARLGFFGIAELHGHREFGKDVVFAELTPLGILKYSAVQTKHVEQLTQTQAGDIGALLEQVRQAFVTPFRLPDSPRDRYVSSVYVMNSGRITEGAKDYLLNTLTRERYGDNVHLLDGPRLIEIARAGAYAVDRDTRRRLQGLLSQAALNRLIWQSHIEQPIGVVEGRPALMSAVESFLTAPYAQEWIDLSLVLTLWQKAAIAEALADRARLVPAHDTARAKLKEQLDRACQAALATNDALIVQVQSALKALAVLHKASESQVEGAGPAGKPTDED